MPPSDVARQSRPASRTNRTYPFKVRILRGVIDYNHPLPKMGYPSPANGRISTASIIADGCWASRMDSMRPGRRWLVLGASDTHGNAPGCGIGAALASVANSTAPNIAHATILELVIVTPLANLRISEPLSRSRLLGGNESGDTRSHFLATESETPHATRDMARDSRKIARDAG